MAFFTCIVVKDIFDKLAVAGGIKDLLPDIIIKRDPHVLRNRLRVRENGRIVFRVHNALRRLRSGVGRFRYIDTLRVLSGRDGARRGHLTLI